MAELASRRASIRVVYALADRQESVDVPFEVGMSVGEAAARSGLIDKFSEIAAHNLVCAIYGRVASLSQSVRPGDRVEILRPLAIDPKESRRQAAARTRERTKSS